MNENNVQFWLSAAVFLAAYAVIVSEKIQKTKVALVGAAIVLLLKLLTQEEGFHDIELGVDWNVVFLLISMMVMVQILQRTGVFQFLAIKSAKLGKGEPFTIMVILALVTAVCSALLDNVTTVLLVAPVTVLVARQLSLDPVPFLITEVIASNIGGASTLIGDPPNIMIASKAGLSFMDFIKHDFPAVVIIMVCWLLVWRLVFKKRLKVSPDRKKLVMEMDEKELIQDLPLLKKSGAVLTLTILGFAFHGVFHYEPATVALAGAAILLLITDFDPHEILAEVEWSTIAFFVGLFIIIGATVKSGVIESLSSRMIALTNPKPDDMFTLAMVMVWFSAIASAIVDNIPFVATMNPLVLDMIHKVYEPGICASAAQNIHNPAVMPVWWALSLGSCLGGNGTAIGASANVIVVGMAEKAGYPITFLRFLKYGVPVMVLSVFISMIYIAVRYYLFG